jgi:uracil-DNA glycosylase family 4
MPRTAKIRPLDQLHADVIACTRCPRLRTYCTQIGVEKRRAFQDETYWTKPVPGFGDPAARIWIVGLAPAAHGANRTGRLFTGDRSGDFLFAALHRNGLANQPTSTHATDGLALHNVYISATARCAPPANKPLPDEIANCSEYLDREWTLLRDKRVFLALGKIGWDATLRLTTRHGHPPLKKVDFAHAAELPLQGNLTLVASYHVSQQNTFTGKLTPTMFDTVLHRCRTLAGL